MVEKFRCKSTDFVRIWAAKSSKNSDAVECIELINFFFVLKDGERDVFPETKQWLEQTPQEKKVCCTHRHPGNQNGWGVEWRVSCRSRNTACRTIEPRDRLTHRYQKSQRAIGRAPKAQSLARWHRIDKNIFSIIFYLNNFLRLDISHQQEYE